MSTPSCSACKYLRINCTEDCMFVPYFPANKYEKYEAVHKVYGESHVATLLNEIDPSQRELAMNSLSFEAEARLLDPVYGCTRFIYLLQCQIRDAEACLAVVKNELASLKTMFSMFQPPPPVTYHHQYHHTPPTMITMVNYDGLLAPDHQLREEALCFESTQAVVVEQTQETQTQETQTRDK